MAVYVDSMKVKYRNMKMCHMIADSTKELLLMVDEIGIDRKWIQHEGSYREHFDICLSKRKQAVSFGAIEITMRELGLMLKQRKHNFK